MAENKDIAHDLFLLLLNLAQFSERTLVIRVFTEAVDALWPGLCLAYTADPARGAATGLNLDTMKEHYGGFLVQGDIAALPGQQRQLLGNAVSMLALLLERLEQQHQLQDKKNHLEEQIAERTRQLEARNSELEREVAQRRQAEDAIRRNEDWLLGLVNILHHPFTCSQDFLDFTLDEAIRLTDSTFGYLYHYDEEYRHFLLNSWSKDVMDQCTITSPETSYALDETGVWGEAVRQRKPIIVNDFHAPNPLKRGYPPGHAPLHSFMTIPIFKGETIVAVVGVANKNGAYTQTDVCQLTLLMDSVWRVLDRDKAETALWEREAQLTSLSDNLPRGMVYQLDFGPDGNDRRFTYVSAGVAALHGVSPAQAMADAQRLYGQISDQDRRIIVEREALALEHMSTFSAEVRVTMPSGETRWRYFTSAPRRLPNSHIVWDGIEIDIEDLIKARQAADSANKAKSEFLANMSHEIRTPLNGILGMLQLMGSTTLNDEQKEYLVTAVKSTVRLTRLLSDILDLSRVEAGKIVLHQAAFDIAGQREAALDIFALEAKEKGLALDFTLDARLPPRLIGDKSRLQQILFNLIGNAIKFTDTGRVQVAVTPLGRQNGFLRVLFTISDTGIGIADDLLHTLFEPFTQAEGSYTRRFQGAGLGLSIVRKLVALLGGALAVDSTEGVGTTMYLSLPFTLPDALPEQGQKSTQQPEDCAGQGALRILFAEDDAVSLLAGKRLLEKSGYVVCTAVDGREALARLTEQPFDLILMDIQMPVMDGVAAARAIRAGHAGPDKAGIPIIAMTAYAMTGDREKFLAAGLNGYVAKPVDIAELHAAITSLTAGKRPARKT